MTTPDTPSPAQITPPQYAYLTEGIHPSRVRQKQGQSHLEAWDVRRTLIRVFGFGGFNIESRYENLVREIEIPPTQQGGKSRWTVVYRVGLRLTIKDADGYPIAYFDDAATGDSVNQPSLGDAHDMALKTAHSQALKRCAVNLGDQFGLSLYNNGGTDPVVKGSLVSPAGAAKDAPTPQDAPPVEGGELDETRHVEPAEPAPSAPPAADGPTQPDLISVSSPAAAVAQLALRTGDVEKIRATWTEAENRGLNAQDVRAVIPADAARLVGCPTRGALTLGAWLTAVGKWAAGQGGMSVTDALNTEGAA